MPSGSLARRATLSVAVVSGSLASLAPLAAAQAPADPPRTPEGAFVVCAAPEAPAPVVDALVAAATTWEQTLVLSGPAIEIDLRWQDRGDRIAAAAGPGRHVRADELPVTDARYPAALANELLGADQLARPTCDRAAGVAEIVVRVHAAPGDLDGLWHLDPTTPVPDDRIDLVTVLRHELAHGLGFLGATTPSPTAPLLFDTFVRDDGTTRQFVLADGTTVQLYDPPPDLPASAGSHTDPDHHAGLMGPLAEYGVRHDRIDATTLAILARLGWRIDADALDPEGAQEREAAARAEARVALVVLYDRLLGRAPDPGGFVFWDAQLSAGRELRDVESAFRSSAEFGGRTASDPFAEPPTDTHRATAATITAAAGLDG